jgi:Xaa-Pro aminopeptidase
VKDSEAEPIVFVDGENVRRSRWPNLTKEQLLERTRTWAEAEGVEPVVVFDGSSPPGATGTDSETADDWLIREAPQHARYWLVTSDRALREAAGAGAERTIGGGAFLELLDEFEASQER